jgi:DNA-binding transcriptional MocR family regulator
MSYNLIVQSAGKVRELRGYRRAIFKAMAEYAHKDGTGIFPSHVVLADDVGCCVKTVERHIAALLELGYVQQVSRRFNNLRTYAIPLEKIGLTVQMVEESLKPRKKKPRAPEWEQEEAAVAQANEQAYERLKDIHTRTAVQKAEARVANLAHQVMQYEEKLRAARVVKNKSQIEAVEPNLYALRNQLQDAQRALETLQHEERERELQT